MTALHFAACHNAHNLVTLLLEECDTDKNESTGGCLGFPVAFAAYFGHEETLQAFMQRERLGREQIKRDEMKQPSEVRLNYTMMNR